MSEVETPRLTEEHWQLIREAVVDPKLSDGAFRALMLTFVAGVTPTAEDVAWARHLLHKRAADGKG